MRCLVLLLAFSPLLCTTMAEAQDLDRSNPPTDEASAGGFAIRRLPEPIIVDGEQWIATQPNWGGEQLVNASRGQFAIVLAQPTEEGDVTRSHLTFREMGGKPVSLSPDVVSYAFIARNRWIFYEPIEVVDTRTWRRYSLSKQFDIGPYVVPMAVSADGQRLVISRHDCPVDCPTAERDYFEIKFPDPAAGARETDPIAELVARLSATGGLWTNGMFRKIDLPATAPIPQVLKSALEYNRYDKRVVTAHRITETRGVRIGVEQGYTAVLVDTDLGRKIVLLRHVPIGWWSRVYDE
ncbi:MAG TPA: hypothetical protein VMK82_07080 [Steroidobacteraceae bacterium]|nr:hypothetical protein [Steroidobacteraceae bacterium]